MSKRVTLSDEDIILITEALSKLSFIGSSTGLRQRVEQILIKLNPLQLVTQHNNEN